jgi:hypothetical protein
MKKTIAQAALTQPLTATETSVLANETGPWLTRLQMDTNAASNASDDDASAVYPTKTLGLAISGGGIRSATFALGILQSMARADWLKHVDLLSTVSGGGYVGTFLGRYFDQLRHVNAPNRKGKFAAHRIVASTLQDSQSPEIRWLRQQSNYLAPTGTGEALFNIATFWRNFLSLHFVLGMLFLGVFGAMNAITYGHWLVLSDSSQGSLASTLAPVTTAISSDLFATSVADNIYATAGTKVSSVSAWWVIAEMLVWLVLFPQCMSYWLVSQDRSETIVLTVLCSYLLIAVAATIALGVSLPIAIFAATIVWMVLAWHNIRRQIGSSNPTSSYALMLARNRLTYDLARSTSAFGVVVTLGVINIFGYLLSQHFVIRDDLTWTSILTQLGYLAAPFLAAAPLLRALAVFLANREDSPKSFLDTLAKIPYLMDTLMVLVGTVLPLSVVAFLSHAAYGNGGSYAVGIGVTLLTIAVSLILGHREALQFVNRSGPFSIYAARLARVFLGAVNPVRQRQSRGGDVTTVILGDDVVHDNYKPHEAGGPLHLFNVTVNETVDVVSQRGLRDRQGENMAVGPAGISISREWHALWRTTNNKNGILVEPIVHGTQMHPLVAKDGSGVYVERLSIRQWMAISGAAISSGAGRYTGAAFSLLVTLANLRLGYWWDSGLQAGKRAQLPTLHTKSEFIKRVCYRLLATQSLLVSELRGRFGGPWRRHFYLSDGGHFENSGVYELLRRRVPYIIAIDGGQDRLQHGTGLGELLRIARIDFGCEFEEANRDPSVSFEDIPTVAKSVLGCMNDLLATNAKPNAKSHATLLRVRYPVGGTAEEGWNGRNNSWLLYIRLTMTGDEPADLMTYRATNPDFPNQTTLDQDFDEPQFESYRCLGQHIGEQLFEAK